MNLGPCSDPKMDPKMDLGQFSHPNMDPKMDLDPLRQALPAVGLSSMLTIDPLQRSAERNAPQCGL